MKGNVSSAIATAALLVPACHAGLITTFSDRTTYNLAVGSTTLETFPVQCIPLTGPVNSTSSCPSGGASLGLQPGATYSAPIAPGNSFNVDGGGVLTSPALDTLLVGRPVGSAPITVTFTNPVAAVGFDAYTGFGSMFTITFDFSGGGSTQFTGNTPGSSFGTLFFGYKSSASDIASVVINGNGTDQTVVVDNFSFGGASSNGVPEPSLWLPVAAAAAWMFWRRALSHRI
jgi:hypothetical protein